MTVAHERHDHLGGCIRLAAPRRPLDRQRAAVEAEAQADRGLERRLARLLERCGDPCDPWRKAQEEIACRSRRAGGVDPVREHPLGGSLERVAHLVHPEVLERDQRLRHALLELAKRSPQGHRQSDLVERMDRTARLGAVIGHRLGVHHVSADLQAMVLQREAVLLEPRPGLVDDPELLDELHAPDWLALVDQLFVTQFGELVEAPPERLVLAPVPVEQLGEEPGRVLLWLPLRRLFGHARGQGRNELSDPLLPIRQRPSYRRLGLHGRTRQSLAELPLQVAATVLQPVAQLEVAHDVVAVVAGDGAQDVLADLAVLRRATLEPRLERDDARPGAAQLDLSLEPVQGLEALDRVAFDARSNALAHDPEQVDEHPRAQQPIDFRLTRRMPLGQPPERCLLVRGVVVDVHRGVGVEALDQQVDELLERRLLGRAGDTPVRLPAPDGMKPRLAGSRRIDECRLEHAEQVLDPVVERERIALDVEEQVVRGRLGEHEQASIGDQGGFLVTLRLEELPLRLPFVLALDLEASLLAHALERLAADAFETGRHWERQDRELATTPDRAVLERPTLAGADPGDEGEVVVAAALVPTMDRPATDVAMLDRLRVRRRDRIDGLGTADRRLELRLDAAVVGHEVGDSVGRGFARAAAEHDVQPLRRLALDPRELLHIRADLEDRAGLGPSRELRVGDLVRPRPELAG